MTTRHSGYVLTLKEDIREDDARELIKLLGLINGVISVKPVESSFELHIAKERAVAELGQKMWDVLYPKSSKHEE